MNKLTEKEYLDLIDRTCYIKETPSSFIIDREKSLQVAKEQDYIKLYSKEEALFLIDNYKLKDKIGYNFDLYDALQDIRKKVEAIKEAKNE